MKQIYRIIVIAVVLCVALMNAGVLHAIHLHQCCDASEIAHHDGKRHSGSSHNPDKCPFCTQLASVKTISPNFTEIISFTKAVEEKTFSLKTVLLSGVSLSSKSPRAPPFVC